MNRVVLRPFSLVMYFRKGKRKQRRFNGQNIFDIETSPIINRIQITNDFLNEVKTNLEVPIINSIQNTNSFLKSVRKGYLPFINAMNHSKTNN